MKNTFTTCVSCGHPFVEIENNPGLGIVRSRCKCTLATLALTPLPADLEPYPLPTFDEPNRKADR